MIIIKAIVQLYVYVSEKYNCQCVVNLSFVLTTDLLDGGMAVQNINWLFGNASSSIFQESVTPLKWEPSARNTADVSKTLQSEKRTRVLESSWTSFDWNSTTFNWSEVMREWVREMLSGQAGKERLKHLLDALDEQKCLWRDAAEVKTFDEITSLIPIEEGAGGAYFACDASGEILFVVKPCDEDIFCVNNRKGYFSLEEFGECLVRENVPSYRAPLTDYLASWVAEEIGLGHITPHAELAVLENSGFHSILDYLDPKERSELSPAGAQCDQEKLCSVQAYVRDAKGLWELLQDMQVMQSIEGGVKDEIDPEDLLDLTLFMWVTNDTDGHLGNILAYVKQVKEDGGRIWGIKKVDNGLSFPRTNEWLRNEALFLLEDRHLPERIKDLIRQIDADAIASKMETLQMDSMTIDAFMRRISYLQRAVDCDKTVYQINSELASLDQEMSTCKS